MSAPDPEILAFVAGAGLLPAGEMQATALTGGVSSDIWLVEAGGRRVVVKRALPALRVAADWQVPVERSVYEAEWLKGAARVAREAVPRLLADDPEAGMLAMEYLAPEDHRWWKGELMEGRAAPAVAEAVGDRLGRIHAAFARDPAAPATFASDAIFRAIRLEPYLEATARAHPGLAGPLMALFERTAATRRTVVHGDVSPKNILLGPEGPVFLDAECAWFGDPAFDLAFCLNHLLLKCLVAPEAVPPLLSSFDALRGAYLLRVDWEDPAEVESRAASLLPGLFLARVDGMSPAEYITAEADREAIRRTAIPLIARPPTRLADMRAAWAAIFAERKRP